MRGVAGALTAMLLALLAGCGHPATHSECEEILRRAAEVELLQQKTPPDKIAARVEEAAQARGSELGHAFQLRQRQRFLVGRGQASDSGGGKCAEPRLGGHGAFGFYHQRLVHFVA